MSEERRLSELFTWRSAITESELRPSARHVALTLSLHMSERGDSAFPSLVTLASETGLHKETVMKALGELERAGYLIVSRRPGARGGRGRTNHYRAVVPKRAGQETVPEDAEALTSGAGAEEPSHPTVPETVGSAVRNGRLSREKRSAQPTRGRTEDVKRTLDGAPRRRDPAFEEIAQWWGGPSEVLTASARRTVGTFRAEIAEAETARLGRPPSPEELAAEIRRRLPAYPADWKRSPAALAKWWPSFERREERSASLTELRAELAAAFPDGEPDVDADPGRWHRWADLDAAIDRAERRSA